MAKKSRQNKPPKRIYVGDFPTIITDSKFFQKLMEDIIQNYDLRNPEKPLNKIALGVMEQAIKTAQTRGLPIASISWAKFDAQDAEDLNLKYYLLGASISRLREDGTLIKLSEKRRKKYNRALTRIWAYHLMDIALHGATWPRSIELPVTLSKP